MNELIEKLNGLHNDLDTLIWLLTSDEFTGFSTVGQEIDCYSNIPEDIQKVFNELKETYGVNTIGKLS